MTHGPISKGVPGSYEHEIQYWRQDFLPFAFFDFGLVLYPASDPFLMMIKDTAFPIDCQGICAMIGRLFEANTNQILSSN